MGAHTPGPWVGHADGAITTADGFAVIAQVHGPIHGVEVSDTQFAADTALLAAAPEMLDALLKIARRLPMTFSECADAEAVIGIAEDAIAKALGDLS